ncbi:unnamed protein product [Zymoseptoria tritici ST99CH_1A5]|uniref:Uncharacterized protein n=1 Tax=Zymoseptoria tritici ST99CH_1A5 TaxID=1276529 RepID=A0A1Y6LVW4_ZYMTR|nr:unnamed protein product [Zymoseptoria tritici ST99CH_1A5]
MNCTTEDPMLMESPSRQSAVRFKEIANRPPANTSFQSTSSPCPPPRSPDSRYDSLQPDEDSQQPAPTSNPITDPKPTPKPLPPPNHPPRKKKKISKHFDYDQQLKLLRQHLLSRCPILSQSSNRIHAIVSWGGNISSTLALRPAVEVQRTFLEDTFPGVYAKEDMYDRLRKGKKEAREGPPPEREWGFGVDPNEGVDRGRLEWRMEEVFDFEGFYGDREAREGERYGRRRQEKDTMKAGGRDAKLTAERQNRRKESKVTAGKIKSTKGEKVDGREQKFNGSGESVAGKERCEKSVDVIQRQSHDEQTST